MLYILMTHTGFWVKLPSIGASEQKETFQKKINDVENTMKESIKKLESELVGIDLHKVYTTMRHLDAAAQE